MKIQDEITLGKITNMETVGRLNVEINPQNLKKVLRTVINMYSDPYFSSLREIIANGIDSHLLHGVNKPVVVTVPTANNRHFVKVRDFGYLEPSDVVNIFFNVFASTKNHTDDQIGGFGTGAKSPFAFTDFMQVSTVVEGEYGREKHVFIASMESTEISCKVLDTDEPCGVEVVYEMGEGNLDFEKLRFWISRTNLPVVFTNWACEKLEPLESGDNWRIFPDSNGTWLNIMGMLYASPTRISDFNGLVVDVPMQNVTILPNRESVQYSRELENFLNDVSQNVREVVTERYVSKFEDMLDMPRYFKLRKYASSISDWSLSRMVQQRINNDFEEVINNWLSPNSKYTVYPNDNPFRHSSPYIDGVPDAFLVTDRSAYRINDTLQYIYEQVDPSDKTSIMVFRGTQEQLDSYGLDDDTIHVFYWSQIIPNLPKMTSSKSSNPLVKVVDEEGKSYRFSVRQITENNSYYVKWTDFLDDRLGTEEFIDLELDDCEFVLWSSSPDRPDGMEKREFNGFIRNFEAVTGKTLFAVSSSCPYGKTVAKIAQETLLLLKNQVNYVEPKWTDFIGGLDDNTKFTLAQIANEQKAGVAFGISSWINLADSHVFKQYAPENHPLRKLKGQSNWQINHAIQKFFKPDADDEKSINQMQFFAKWVGLNISDEYPQHVGDIPTDIMENLQSWYINLYERYMWVSMIRSFSTWDERQVNEITNYVLYTDEKLGQTTEQDWDEFYSK